MSVGWGAKYHLLCDMKASNLIHLLLGDECHDNRETLLSSLATDMGGKLSSYEVNNFTYDKVDGTSELQAGGVERRPWLSQSSTGAVMCTSPRYLVQIQPLTNWGALQSTCSCLQVKCVHREALAFVGLRAVLGRSEALGRGPRARWAKLNGLLAALDAGYREGGY